MSWYAAVRYGVRTDMQALLHVRLLFTARQSDGPRCPARKYMRRRVARRDARHVRLRCESQPVPRQYLMVSHDTKDVK